MNQKKVFMFEQLLQYCEGQPASISKLLGLDYNPMDFGFDEQEMVRLLYEKYAGTWWEVTLDDLSDVAGENLPACVYLADSIQDALRLRPQTSESYWQNALHYFDEMIFNMCDIEEECV
ncbi:MAG: hypothetical protein ABSE89_09080 [Sedimentisphaerales bacterium]